VCYTKQVADFELSAPRAQERALLVEVPHAGVTIPEALRGEIIASEQAMLRDADLFVDRLYAHAPERGAHLLVAKLSRYVVDLNRAQHGIQSVPIDAAHGNESFSWSVPPGPARCAA